MQKPGRTWRYGVALTWLMVSTVVFFTANPCQAGEVKLTDFSPVLKAFTDDGRAVITTTPIKPLSANEFNSSLINADYPGWTINTPATSPGTFSVTSYKAGSSKDVSSGTFGGGANIAVTTPLSESKQQLRWVQIISTNAPPEGKASTYIDTSSDLPFYWTDAELPNYADGQTLKFYDYAKRGADLLKTTDSITWQGNLFLTTYDGGKTLTPHDGLQWGFEMKSATQGNSSGKFLNPSGPSPSKTVVSGAGTNKIDYGVGPPRATQTSEITFTPVGFDPVPNDIFSVGKLTFGNYPTADGTEIDRLELELSLNLINSGKNITLTTPLTLVSTINTGDDKTGDADYVSLIAGRDIYSFYVYENSTAKVDILGRLTATPDFADISGINQDKSTDPYGNSFVSDITYKFELVGFGNLDDPNGFVTDKALAAPLPGTMGLMVLGLSLIVIRRKRGQRKEYN